MSTIVRLGNGDAMLSRINAQYRPVARQFLRWCDLEGYSVESLRGFLAWLDERPKPVAASTYNRYLAACKATIRAMVESPDLTAAQRFELERSLREFKSRKRVDVSVDTNKLLSRDEIERLVAESPERTALVIRVIASTGLRVSEATGIRLDHCLRNGRVKIRVLGKGQRERWVSVSRELFDRCRAVFAGSAYLFETRTGNPLHDRNVAKEIDRMGWKILGKHVMPHMLRHSFATHVLEDSGNVVGVSKYLGHASAQTTLDLYVHSNLTPEDLPAY